MRITLWLLALLLFLLPAKASRAAFISLENPVPGVMMMTWDVVFNPSSGGDTLGSIDFQATAVGADVTDLAGTEFLKGSVLDDPNSSVFLNDVAMDPTVSMGGFNEGVETTTTQPTAFGTLTVSWTEPRTGPIVIRNDDPPTGFLDKDGVEIADTTLLILATLPAPAASACSASVSRACGRCAAATFSGSPALRLREIESPQG